MCKGQARFAVCGILLLAVAAGPAHGEDAPVPKAKPDAQIEPQRTPSLGGRKSGATFYEIDGAVPVTWSKAEAEEARAGCPKLLEGLDLTYKPVDPIGGPEGCGAPAPIEVSAVVGIAISPPATLTCSFAATFHKWARGALQQAAKAALDDEVKSVKNVASYTCRHRRGDGPKRLSEHALSNALDISAFRLKSGDTVSVTEDWDPPGKKATFLRYVHESACEVFSTVLGPDHNALHKDHFHFDYGRGGRYGLCH